MISDDQLQAVIAHCGKQFVEGWEMGLSDPRLFPNQDPAMLAFVDAYIKEYGTFKAWRRGDMFLVRIERCH